MKSSIVPFVLLLAVASCFAFVAQPLVDSDKDKKEWGAKCDGHDLDFKSAQASYEQVLHTCLDKYGKATELKTNPTDEDKMKDMKIKLDSIGNNTCFSVCFGQEWKLFDDKGAINKTGVDAFVDSILPKAAEVASKMKTEVAKCPDDKGPVLSMENNCTSYMDYYKCIEKKVVEVCKIDVKINDHSK